MFTVIVPYPRIPPVLIQIGPFAIRWYGIMYVLGYSVGYWLALRRVGRNHTALTRANLDALIGYLVAGMLIGARLTYVIVYGAGEYRANPWEVFAVWRGGLSFHGAVLGMAVASALFARRHHLSFLRVTDVIALCGTPGLFFGRLGNFINGELYGRRSNVPWAMIFPADPQHVPRHPSQLYEALAEGLLLGSFLWWLDRRNRRGSPGGDGRNERAPGLLTGAFLVGYATLRFLLEFTREPDAQLGFVLGRFSMGQLLSAAMFFIGVAVLGRVRSRSER